MPNKSFKMLTLRESWRPDPASDPYLIRKRIALRAFALGLLAIVVVGFCYLLFVPFFHPTTRLYFLTTAPLDSRVDEPIPFVQTDAIAFLQSDGSFQQEDVNREFFLLSSPETFPTAIAKIASEITQSSDVAIVYLSGHATLIDGRAYLRCSNFEQANPQPGCYSLQELFERLKSFQPATTVLLLDIGHTEQDISVGGASNLPSFIATALEASNNKSLWILSAHAAGEQSNRSLGLRSTIFSNAVARALAGNADLNRDRAIDLEEFHQYVAAETLRLVTIESSGLAKQNPQLLSNNKYSKELGRSIVLASAPPQSWGESLVPAALASSNDGTSELRSPPAPESPEKADESRSWLTSVFGNKLEGAKDTASEELRDNINILPTFLSERVKQSLGLEESDSATTPVAPKSEVVAADPSPLPEQPNTPGESPAAAKLPSSVQASNLDLPDLSRLGEAGQSNRQLMRFAWQFCESMERPSHGFPRPLDHAPHVWKAYIAFLHRLEEYQRVDSILDPKNERVQLVAEIVGSYQLTTTGKSQVGRMIQQISAQMPSLNVSTSALPSLGACERFFEFGGEIISSEINNQLKLLDESLAAENRSPFDKWLEQLPEKMSAQYSEFSLAKKFASRPATPWTIVRKAIQLLRIYEQLIYDPMCSNLALETQLAQANRIRLAGTRRALDQIGSVWQEQCLQDLHGAEYELLSVKHQLDEIRMAWQFRNHLLCDMEAILGWRQIMSQRLGKSELDHDVLGLLELLSKQSEFLQQRENANPAEIGQYSRQLQEIKSRIDKTWIAQAQSLMTDFNTNNKSTYWLLDSLLSTSLIRNSLRNQLATIQIQPANIVSGQQTTAPVLSKFLADNQGKQFQIEKAWAVLAGWQAPAEPQGTGIPMDEELRPQSNEWESSLQESIAEYLGSLPNKIQSLQGGQTTIDESGQLIDARIKKLRQAEQSLRMLPSNLAANFNGRQILEELWRLEFAQRLGARQASILASLEDALPDEDVLLRNTFQQLAVLHASLSGTESVVPKPVRRVVAEGNDKISLLSNPLANAEVRFKNLGKTLDRVWIVVDYDANLLEVDSALGNQFYHAQTLPSLLAQSAVEAEQQLVSALSSGDSEQASHARTRLDEIRENQAYPQRPLPSNLPPSREIASGQEIVIPFRARRVGLGPATSKIVWKLIGNGDYVRHEQMVQLPLLEKMRLTADGSSSGWVESPEGITLHMWPNRASEYRFGLVNDDEVPRILQVELLALTERREVSLPNGFLTEAAARDIALRLGDMSLLANIPEVRLEGGGPVVWLPPVQSGPPPEQGEAAKTDDSSAVETASQLLAKPSVQHGIVALITDKKNLQKLWRRIDTRIRHPRGYVEPLVSYDALAERVEIRLRNLSTQGSDTQEIPVRGRIVEPMPRGTEMRLEGFIVGSEQLVLFSQVPISAPRELTFELDVDGFPRAFVFQVPCWRTANQIASMAGRQRIRIVEPTEGVFIGPNSLQQRVRLQVDTIPGAFESKRDFVEIGWDLDRDREFQSEATLKLTSDRHVDIRLSRILNGKFAFSTMVDDLLINLAPPSINNAPVNLLARISAAGELVWSDPVEIIADSEPPLITGIDISPAATVVQGNDLLIRIGVDDSSLSGVARVEFVVTTRGTGKFEPQDELISCERQADGAWTASVSTKALQLGRSMLLVRAADNAGNVSDVTSTAIEIFDLQEWTEFQKRVVREVTGSATYGETSLANAKIVLLNEKLEAVYQTTTGEDGTFRLPSVGLGKYTLTVLGVAKNRPRKAELEIEVKPLPAPPVRVRLLAK